MPVSSYSGARALALKVSHKVSKMREEKRREIKRKYLLLHLWSWGREFRMGLLWK